MEKSVFEAADELVNRINTSGCRVTIPYAEPCPLSVVFGGTFDDAEFIPSYPATLHIYGFNGHISVSAINSIDELSHNKCVINFGDDAHQMDMLVKILE